MDTQPLMIMKGRCKYSKLFWLPVMWWMLLESACERRPLDDDELPRAASIHVRIDWSRSGLIPASAKDPDVHRVSIRFFPKSDDMPVFDLFLEGNVTEGTILVPIGRYSVIVFNESVDDIAFWQDGITFTDANSYSKFAANAIPLPDAKRKELFPFYQPGSGERIIADPIPLASWSLDDFEVTEGMVLVSHGEKSADYLSSEENDMLDALINVVMRALTRPVNVTAQIGNLVSSHINYLAMKGLANKVYMASGLTTQSPSTCLFTLNRRKYDADGKNGMAGATFLSFGRTPGSGNEKESYLIAGNVLFITGELYKPTPPLLFDVTGQVLLNYSDKMSIDVKISYNLPFVEGGIGVDDWEDDVYTLK